MKFDELEHVIRAVAEITNRYEFVIVGSQSILGTVSNPPSECVVSNEVDVYPLDDEALSDVIDGAIGEGSQFHETYGYYAQGVDSTTSTLPAGWKDRLCRVQTRNTNDRIGYCLEPTDLFLSKCFANREKDRIFNLALLREGIVDVTTALGRVSSMPVSRADKDRMTAQITSLSESLGPPAAAAHARRARARPT